MISETKLKTLKHFEELLEELLKDSERLEWLIKFFDRLGLFTEADLEKLGFEGKNIRHFIDLLMDIPIDELLANWGKEQ